MMEEQDGIWERNRTGCPIHKRQEKILRVNIGREVLGYRVITTTTRGREIIEVSEPIRLFFYSLDGELDLKPITRPMRIARYRVCEWRYAETTSDKYGHRIGDLEKFNRGEENHGCVIRIEEQELVPIWNRCSECKKFTSNLEDTYQVELDYSCIECFCENTDQQPNNY